MELFIIILIYLFLVFTLVGATVRHYDDCVTEYPTRTIILYSILYAWAVPFMVAYTFGKWLCKINSELWKVVTTVEQSKKLLKLGLSPKTADMIWVHKSPDKLLWKFPISVEALGSGPGVYDIPCWSLDVLLDMIPQTLITDNGDEYTLQMSKDDDLTYVFGYYCEYTATTVVEFVSQEAVKATFEMVCWLLENNYIENK